MTIAVPGAVRRATALAMSITLTLFGAGLSCLDGRNAAAQTAMSPGCLNLNEPGFDGTYGGDFVFAEFFGNETVAVTAELRPEDFGRTDVTMILEIDNVGPFESSVPGSIVHTFPAALLGSLQVFWSSTQVPVTWRVECLAADATTSTTMAPTSTTTTTSTTSTTTTTTTTTTSTTTPTPVSTMTALEWAPDSPFAGEPVTLTATVTESDSGEPLQEGSVSFSVDGSLLGTVDVVGGSAVLETGSFIAGEITASARFNPPPGFAVSAVSELFAILAPRTATTLTSSTNPAPASEPVTFTATVMAVVDGVPVTAGSVTFFDTDAPLATIGVDSDGQATFSYAPADLGQIPITARYDGAGQFSPSESSIIQAVTPQPTLTDLTSSQNPSALGEQVTLTARVSDNGAAVPDGEVVFSVDGVSEVSLDLDSSGTATFMTADLTLGDHLIAAAYQGLGEFAPSSTELTQRVVGPVPTVPSTTTTSSTTSPTSPPATSPATSTPTSSTPATTTPMSNATTTTTPTARSSSTSTTVPAELQATATRLTSSANPSFAGDPVTFAVEVSPTGASGPIGLRRPSATPAAEGGSVTISAGPTVLAVVALEDGRAAYTTTALSAGTHTITAAFTGTATAAPSSDTVVQRVDAAGQLPETR